MACAMASLVAAAASSLLPFRMAWNRRSSGAAAGSASAAEPLNTRWDALSVEAAPAAITVLDDFAVETALAIEATSAVEAAPAAVNGERNTPGTGSMALAN